jgi:hypothetical protein
VPRLFTANNRSILTIKVVCDEDESCTTYLFIVHYQTLLGRAERALSRHKIGPEVAVRWEEWGPDVTRMFWYDHEPYTAPFDAPCGSRLFIRGQGNNFLEVYDFGRAASSPTQVPEESQTPGTPRWIMEQDDDPECQGNWLQDVVHTKLPFVCQTLKGSVDGDSWDTMYVDQSRIVGIKDVRLSYPISLTD